MRLTHWMNNALGNTGKTVIYTDPITIGPAHSDPVSSLRELADALDAGRVQLLVMLGGNPVYDAPADFDFGSNLAKANIFGSPVSAPQ